MFVTSILAIVISGNDLFFQGNFLGGLFRHFVRRALPASPAGSTQTSPSGSMRRTPTKALAFTEAPEQKFFKLADVFVKQVLR